MSNENREELYGKFYRLVERFSKGEIEVDDIRSEFSDDILHEILDNSFTIFMLSLQQSYSIFQMAVNHLYYINVLLDGTDFDEDSRVFKAIELYSDSVEETIKSAVEFTEEVIAKDMVDDIEIYELRLKDLKDMLEDEEV